MKIKKEIEQSISDAIASIASDITTCADHIDNVPRSQAIKELAEAYDLVHRGKKGK